MSPFVQFALEAGFALALMGVMLLWAVRSSGVNVAWKVLLSASLAGTACLLPFGVTGLMGLPVPTTEDALPARLQLLADTPNEDESRVALWGVDFSTTSQPRAYDVPMSKELKETLRDANARLQRGEPVTLRRKGEGEQPDEGDDGDDQGTSSARAANRGGSKGAAGQHFVVDASRRPRK